MLRSKTRSIKETDTENKPLSRKLSTAFCHKNDVHQNSLVQIASIWEPSLANASTILFSYLFLYTSWTPFKLDIIYFPFCYSEILGSKGIHPYYRITTTLICLPLAQARVSASALNPYVPRLKADLSSNNENILIKKFGSVVNKPQHRFHQGACYFH